MVYDWDYLCPQHGCEENGALVGALEVMGSRETARYSVAALECMHSGCRVVAVRRRLNRRPWPAPWLVTGDGIAEWWPDPWPSRPLSVLDEL